MEIFSMVRGLSGCEAFIVLHVFKKEGLEISVELSEIESFLDRCSLEVALEKLMKITVSVFRDGKNERLSVFNKIVQDKDKITFSFNPDAYFYISKLDFAQYDADTIKALAGFRSGYTARFYLFLKRIKKENKNKSIVSFPIRKIRSELNIPDSYTNHDIKRRIFDRALKEINGKTDVSFEFEVVGRKESAVVNFKFTTEHSEPHKDSVAESPLKPAEPDSEYRRFIGKTITIGGLKYVITENGIIGEGNAWSLDEVLNEWDRWKPFIEKKVS